jgi:F-type H+-transporting ATPase subunit b
LQIIAELKWSDMEGLGVNLPLLVAFLINFIILFVLLSFVLYKPVLKMLDERQARIKEGMDQTEKIRLQTSKAEEDLELQLETARKDGQNIIAQAEQIGERLKNEARDEARKEAASLIEKAQVEIKQEREKDIKELRQQFADIAILAAEKVINESLDKAKHRKVIEEVLKDTAFK